MNDQTRKRANGLTSLALVYGFLLAAFYVLAGFKAGAIMGYLSTSGWYAVAGVGVAAIFLHVAFAMSLYSTLRARSELRRAEDGVVAMKKRTAQWARARAYINPWHNV